MSTVGNMVENTYIIVRGRPHKKRKCLQFFVRNGESGPRTPSLLFPVCLPVYAWGLSIVAAYERGHFSPVKDVSEREPAAIITSLYLSLRAWITNIAIASPAPDNLKTSGLYKSISLPPTGTVFEYYAHFYPPGLGGVRSYEWRSWTADVPSFE